MTASSANHRLLQLILSALGSESLNADDYRIALEPLRSGKLAQVLDVLLSTLAGESTAKPSNNTREKRPLSTQGIIRRSPDELTDDIKRRKIGRDQLEEILFSIDRGIYEAVAKSETIRNLVKAFFEKASDRQWTILSSIVNGQHGHDPHFNSDR